MGKADPFLSLVLARMQIALGILLAILTITQKQAAGKPYLNGYNHLLLRSSVPGVDPSMIYDGLPGDDPEIIQTQMTRTLEWITPVFVLNHTLNI